MSALNKALPLLFECKARQIERVIVRALFSIPWIKDHLQPGRLLAVRIVPDGNFTRLAFVI